MGTRLRIAAWGLRAWASGLTQLQPGTIFLLHAVEPEAGSLTCLSLSCRICEVWELGAPPSLRGLLCRRLSTEPGTKAALGQSEM